MAMGRFARLHLTFKPKIRRYVKYIPFRWFGWKYLIAGAVIYYFVFETELFNYEETYDTTTNFEALNWSRYKFDDSLPGDYMSKFFPLESYFARMNKPSPPKDMTSILSFGPQEDIHIPLRIVLILTADLENPKHTGIRIFRRLRIDTKIVLYSDPLPQMVLPGLGRPVYSMIFVDDYSKYLDMNEENRQILDSYCRDYSVGILATMASAPPLKEYSHIKLRSFSDMTGYQLNSEVGFWRVAKPSKTFLRPLSDEGWTTFENLHETFRPVAFSTKMKKGAPTTKKSNFRRIIAVQDIGLLDRIPKVILSNNINYWLNTIVALDAMDYLSHGRFRLPLERYIQVDIDDVFRGQKRDKILPKDVQLLESSQEKIQKFIPNFKFVFGFAGRSFYAGSNESIEANTMLAQNQKKFRWFNHMYNHTMPINLNMSEIVTELNKNLKLAKEKKITVMKTYMVPPVQAGTYPAYDAFYNALNKVGITSVGTDKYPVIEEDLRRGFIYKGIRNVPRTNAGISTQTNRFDNSRFTRERLSQYASTGDLFQKVLLMQVIVFLSHVTNYGSDHLAPFLFETVFTATSTWTNLKLNAPEPPSIVDTYFKIYPKEATVPLWRNPCDHEPHRLTWPEWIPCGRIPDIYLVGPARTGAAVLQNFLSSHPNLASELPVGSRLDLNFFHGAVDYEKGLLWYLDKYELIPRSKRVQLYTKGNNYFLSQVAPGRIHALNPRAKVIIVAAEPVQRAYSWFLHYTSTQKNFNYTFYQVLSAPDDAPSIVCKLRDRCLQPGLYAANLARYLYYFDKKQILVVDADELRVDPFAVLANVEKFAGLKPLDYSKKIVYFHEADQYCLVATGCTSYSAREGRDPMDEQSAQFLETYYQGSNQDFRVLLGDLGQPLPQWLQDESFVPPSSEEDESTTVPVDNEPSVNQGRVEKEKEGENIEGEKVEGEKVVGEKVEGEKVEGEKVEGEKFQGEKVEGEKVGELHHIEFTTTLPPPVQEEPEPENIW